MWSVRCLRHVIPRRCCSLPPENRPIVLLHNLAHKHAVDAPKSGSEIRAGLVDETRVVLFFAKAHGDIWFYLFIEDGNGVAAHQSLFEFKREYCGKQSKAIFW